MPNEGLIILPEDGGDLWAGFPKPAPQPVRRAWVQLSGKRADDWKMAVGTDVFPVTSLTPETAQVLGEHHLVFFLDTERLDRKQIEAIAAYLTHKFGQTPDETVYEMRTAGVPILAAGARAFEA